MIKGTSDLEEPGSSSLLAVQAILRARLESLWHLLVALPAGPTSSHAPVPEGLENSLRWEGLESLACIPSQSGMLVRLRHRQMVVVLPVEAEEICKSVPNELDTTTALPNQMTHAPPNLWTVAMLRVSHIFYTPALLDLVMPITIRITHLHLRFLACWHLLQ